MASILNNWEESFIYLVKPKNVKLGSDTKKQIERNTKLGENENE